MLIYITSRKLCKDPFLQRIQQLAEGNPHAIMLREKDLNLADYESLTLKVKAICAQNNIPLIINQNLSIAKRLNMPNIHLSIQNLRTYRNELQSFTHIGASVHSLSEALEAQKLGATYLVAGHIYSTNSKKGVPPRGLSFLREITSNVTIPVFAIGGITKDHVKDILLTGAKGICIMSEAMTCPEPVKLKASFLN